MTDTEGSSIEVTDTEGSSEKVGSYRYTSVKHLRLRPPALNLSIVLSQIIKINTANITQKFVLVYFHHPT